MKIGSQSRVVEKIIEPFAAFVQQKNREVPNPPEILWHYTTYDAFISIIKDQSLRLSELGYQNDSGEYWFFNEIVQGSLRSMQENNDEVIKSANYLRQFFYQAGFRGFSNVFSFSLTEKADSLSQWRAYANRGEGVALGFSVGDVPDGVYLGRCYYSEVGDKEFDDVFRSVVINLSNSFKHNDGNHNLSMAGLVASALIKIIFEASPYVKHKGFAEECEWRVTSYGGEDKAEYDFFAKNYGMVMAKKIKFSAGLSLKKVMIGPSPFMLRNKFTVSAFLKQKNLNVEVLSSEISYRKQA